MTEVQTVSQPIQSPGEIPDKFLSGSIIVCEKISHEANSNALSIIGAFNGLNIEYQGDMTTILATATQIPIPPLQIFARITSKGYTQIPWRIFARILSFNGIAQNNCGFLNAEDILTLKNANLNQGDIRIPFPGIGINLTSERKATIKPDGIINVLISFEVWISQTFLVAQTVTLCYNKKQESPNAVVTDPTDRGTK